MQTKQKDDEKRLRNSTPLKTYFLNQKFLEKTEADLSVIGWEAQKCYEDVIFAAEEEEFP